jgi:TonB-linked SusC/RagA family outer membrane protein
MNTWNDWNWTNTLNYQKIFAEKHNVNAMVGYTMEKFSNYWLTGSRDAVPSNNENLRYVSAGTENEKSSGSDSFSTLVSYLGRVMYNYDSRYYVTASIRFDGSSKFPEGKKFATFPAISAAWRVTGEEFMKSQNIFSNLKLRLGWGKVGNQSIDNSAYLSTIGTTYYVINGETTTATVVGSTANPNIQWETVEDYNFGIDMGFLDDRLTATLELYKKKTSDMLLKEAHLAILGYPEWAGEVWTNVGSMEGNGWELSLNWKDNIRNDIKYEVGVNLSGVKNKAKDLGTSDPILTGGFNGDYIIKNESDAEISRFYGFETAGIFQNWEQVASYTNEHGDALQPYAQPGDLIFVDRNNDGKIDNDDKTYLGNAFPKMYLGINLGASYKNWDFSMNLYGTMGNKIFNKTKGYYSGVSGQNVWEGTYDDAWHTEGQDTDIPRLSYNDANKNFTTVSDWFVEKGSYLRCKQLQVGYTFEKSKIRIGTLRLSLSAQNLFTITKYSGFDPETAATGSVTESGIDGVAYPNTKIFLFGVNLNF